ECLLHAAAESIRLSDIVPLPRARLENQIVGVGLIDEVLNEVGAERLERCRVARPCLPQLVVPPLLREEPTRPDRREELDAARWASSVVAAVEGRIQFDRADL